MHGLRYLDGPLYALTSALQRLTAACETHWMRHMPRRRRARLMLDVQGHWQCAAAETGTIYDDVFTGSTRRRHGLTCAGAWSRYTDSFSQLQYTYAAAGGCQSEWTLDRRCSVDIITTLTLRGTTSTVSLSARIV